MFIWVLHLTSFKNICQLLVLGWNCKSVIVLSSSLLRGQELDGRHQKTKDCGEGEGEWREELTSGLRALQRFTALLPDHGVDTDQILSQWVQALKNKCGHGTIHKHLQRQGRMSH